MNKYSTKCFIENDQPEFSKLPIRIDSEIQNVDCKLKFEDNLTKNYDHDEIRTREGKSQQISSLSP